MRPNPTIINWGARDRLNRQGYHKHKFLVLRKATDEAKWRRVDDGYCFVRQDLLGTRRHLHINEPHPSAVLDRNSSPSVSTGLRTLDSQGTATAIATG